MSEKRIGNIAPAFAWMLPLYQQVGVHLGYAVAVHGSMNRDLDLIAIPWVDNAASAEELVEAIRERVYGKIIGGPTKKPHGRLAWTIEFDVAHGHIDLSIMPRKMPEPDDKR